MVREEDDFWEHGQDVGLSWADAPKLALSKAAPRSEWPPESQAGPLAQEQTRQARRLSASSKGEPQSRRDEVGEEARQEAQGLLLPEKPSQPQGQECAGRGADLATGPRRNTGRPPPLRLLRNPKGGGPGPGRRDSVTVDFVAPGVQTPPAGREAKAPAAFSSSVKWGLASLLG